eukprot:scaffold3945_cov134-Skeletonema_marinoi.AAC.4
MILRLISILLACASIEAFAPSTGCRSATSLHSTLPSAPSIKLDRQDADCKSATSLHSTLPSAPSIKLDRQDADCKSATSLHSTVPSSPTFKLDPQDAWIEQLDYAGFAKEVTALGKELQKNTGQADVDHLNKIVSWRNIAAAIGVSTMWMPPNPLTIIALSTWTYASWTMIAHHACHGGYNRVDAGKFNSRGFALGSVKKRIEDWCDWMMPEAWNVEHNRLHHYHLGEDLDPDLVERNLSFLREMDIPKPLKYGVALALMSIWKSYYYAPNTFKELQITKWRQEGRELPTNFDPNEPVTLRSCSFQKMMGTRQLLRLSTQQTPLLLFPGLEPTLFSHAVVNLVLAEMLTNIHGFITIVTNHAGSDLYKFRDEVQPKSGSFYVRQVVSSANYNGGSDLLDFSQGWLNYQIEHHVWPDLSMKQYQLGAPKLEEICQKYGVPYVKENVFVRLAKTLNIMVGQSSMREFPTEMEPQKDKARKGVTWKSTNGAIDEPE